MDNKRDPPDESDSDDDGPMPMPAAEDRAIQEVGGEVCLGSSFLRHHRSHSSFFLSLLGRGEAEKEKACT
jgi:hypothetical protein